MTRVLIIAGVPLLVAWVCALVKGIADDNPPAADCDPETWDNGLARKGAHV